MWVLAMALSPQAYPLSIWDTSSFRWIQKALSEHSFKEAVCWQRRQRWRNKSVFSKVLIQWRWEKRGLTANIDKHWMQEDSGKGISLTQSTFEQSLRTSQGNPQLNSDQYINRISVEDGAGVWAGEVRDQMGKPQEKSKEVWKTMELSGSK